MGTNHDRAQFQQLLDIMKQNYMQQQSDDPKLGDTSSQNIKATTKKTQSHAKIPSKENEAEQTKIRIFNLDEPEKGIEDWKSKDLQNVNEIFVAIGVHVTVTNAFRLGQINSDGRPRRILVEFSNKTDQQKVLANAEKLKGHSKWSEITLQPFRFKEARNDTCNANLKKCEQESIKEEAIKPSTSKRKTKKQITLNPFLTFASTSNDNTTKIPEQKNILVIGQTGVGKSTWINGIANYMSFNSFDDAFNAQPPACLIPMTFDLCLGGKREKVNMKPNIGIKDENEADASNGQSCTQEPKVYQYITDTVIFNLIDTPGIGDTRGVEYDVENMKTVMKCISNWDKIHGICLLLKPNDSRLTHSLRYCIEELLVNLHKESIPNISVVFTNSCSTLHKPGDTMTVLTKLFEDVRNSSQNFIELSSSNIFCIDNEAVKLLYTNHHKIKLEKAYVINFSKSWSHTVEETFRLFEYVKDLTPHSAEKTRAIYQIRQTLTEISTILAEINEEILRYQKIQDQQKSKYEIIKKKVDEIRSSTSVKAEFIHTTHEKKIQDFRIPINQKEIDGLENDIKAIYLDSLGTKHQLEEFQQQYAIIKVIGQPYFEFLRCYSIIGLNSAFEEYLKFSIDQCEKTLRPNENRFQKENLQKLLAVHQQQKILAKFNEEFLKHSTTNSHHKITFQNYASHISSLRNHYVLGPKLVQSKMYKKLLENFEFKIVKISPKIQIDDYFLKDLSTVRSRILNQKNEERVIYNKKIDVPEIKIKDNLKPLGNNKSMPKLATPNPERMNIGYEELPGSSAPSWITYLSSIFKRSN